MTTARRGRYTIPMPNDNVYLNGKILPARSASVSVYDAGFLLGASTFTTMLARNGSVFRIDRHIRRLRETVALLGLAVEVDADLLSRETHELLRINELADARCRITLTPGSTLGESQTTLITAVPKPDHPREWYTEGISVVVSTFKQVTGHPTFGYKTGNYLVRSLAMQEAAAKGAQEALWFTLENQLAEGCTSNVFLALEGVLYTPPRDTPVLPGIVRQTVLELCEAEGIEVRDDRPLTVREMLDAGEVFMTGSVKGIVPVTRIEAHTVGDGEVGPLTRKLMDAYAKLLEAECPPQENEG
ncbi:MAG: aminotransferase class IV, partial [Phycisphaerae bacterium]